MPSSPIHFMPDTGSHLIPNNLTLTHDPHFTEGTSELLLTVISHDLLGQTGSVESEPQPF